MTLARMARLLLPLSLLVSGAGPVAGTGPAAADSNILPREIPQLAEGTGGFRPPPTVGRPPTGRPPGTPGGDAARNAARDAANQAREGAGGTGGTAGGGTAGGGSQEPVRLPPNYASLPPAERAEILERVIDQLSERDLGNLIMDQFIEASGRDGARVRSGQPPSTPLELLEEAVAAVIRGQKQERAVAAVGRGVLPEASFQRDVKTEAASIQASDARHGTTPTKQPLRASDGDPHVRAAEFIEGGAEVLGRIHKDPDAGYTAAMNGDRHVVMEVRETGGKRRVRSTINRVNDRTVTSVQTLYEGGTKTGILVTEKNPGTERNTLYGNDPRPVMGVLTSRAGK